jgi:hypothetical protein
VRCWHRKTDEERWFDCDDMEVLERIGVSRILMLGAGIAATENGTFCESWWCGVTHL